MKKRPLSSDGRALKELLSSIDDGRDFVVGVIVNASTDDNFRTIIKYIQEERENGREPTRSDVIKLSIDLNIASSAMAS